MRNCAVGRFASLGAGCAASKLSCGVSREVFHAKDGSLAVRSAPFPASSKLWPQLVFEAIPPLRRSRHRRRLATRHQRPDERSPRRQNLVEKHSRGVETFRGPTVWRGFAAPHRRLFEKQRSPNGPPGLSQVRLRVVRARSTSVESSRVRPPLESARSLHACVCDVNEAACCAAARAVSWEEGWSRWSGTTGYFL